MYFFLGNWISLVFVWLTWCLLGAGLIVAIAPKPLIRAAWCLTPLIGMILIGSVGLFRIEILRVPSCPWFDLCALGLTSLGLFWRFRNRLKVRVQDGSGFQTALILVPLLYLSYTAYLFHSNGFHTLSGGQDEIQYSLNATQIYKYQHRGGPMDSPAPRADHWVTDFSTKELPYNQTYRRGAEILLVSIFSELGILPEQAFPVTVSCAIASLLFGLGFLLTLFNFGKVLRPALIMQLIFACSFHFLLYLIQGSLGYLCSIGMFMIAIPLFSLSLQDNSWRLAILSGIFVSGTFIFYAEAAFAFQLIPLTLAVFGYCILRPKDIPSTIRVVAVFLCTVCICAHQSNYTAYVDFLGNLQTVLAPTTSHLNHSITQHFKDIFHTLRSETWSLYPPIVGLYSYYSQAHSNSSITGLVSAHPSWTLTIFFLLSFFGWMGYLKRIQLASFSLLLTVSVLSSLVLISLKNEDVLRFVRASSYTYLFALLGTILLALPSSRQLHGFLGAIPWKALSRISALFLFFLFIVNCLTIWNTTRFIIKHDLHNDPIIRRFNPTDSMWLALKEELTPSQDTPVLISGFNNSVYPHLIASGIRPIPHFLGSSIASFWKILNTGPAICGDKCDQRYTTHLSNEEAKAILASPDWSILIPDFLKRSRQALVPQGHLFPIEWRDVFALKRTRFPNFCDVVYKTEHAVDLSPGMMSDRHRDTSGLFRFLQKDGVIQPRDLRGNCFLLKILYDGSPQSLRLRSHHQKITQTTKQIGSQSELSAQITYDDALQITLIRNHVPLKLRWLDWQAIACNSK